MITQIKINDFELNSLQIELFRKHVIAYYVSVSDMISESLKRNLDLVSLPGQRRICHELVEAIDGIVKFPSIPDCRLNPPAPNPTYIVINGSGMSFPYGEITRMALSSDTDLPLTDFEEYEVQVLQKAIFTK